jgi:hypothetical protein
MLLRTLLVFLAAVLSSVTVARELLVDPAFTRGLRVMPVGSAQTAAVKPKTCLPVSDCTSQPVWTLQQWSTAKTISEGIHSTASPVQHRWLLRDAAGRVQKQLLWSPGDALLGDVTLELNGASEFAARDADGVARYLPDMRQPWPHLLLSQHLDSGRLDQYASLRLRGDIRVPFDEPQHQVGYSRARHAARLVMAITVRNRLTGNYFWLTLPLYDDRMPVTDFGCQKCTAEPDGLHCRTPQHLHEAGVWHCPEDKVGEDWVRNEKPGTARMIFRMPTAAFLPARVQQGEWATVEGDLLPYIHAGIEAVRERHNGRTFPTDMFFYELGLFSIGWEVTGFNHVAGQLRHWSLMAHPAVNP